MNRRRRVHKVSRGYTFVDINVLKLARSKYTIRNIADALEVSPSTIVRWGQEKGAYKTMPRAKLRLLKALVKPKIVFKPKPEPEPEPKIKEPNNQALENSLALRSTVRQMQKDMKEMKSLLKKILYTVEY